MKSERIVRAADLPNEERPRSSVAIKQGLLEITEARSRRGRLTGHRLRVIISEHAESRKVEFPETSN